MFGKRPGVRLLVSVSVIATVMLVCLWNQSAALAAITPTFEAARNLAVGSGAYQIAVADFNKDGKPDMAVTTLVGVAILLGDGTGNFSAPTMLTPGSYTSAIATSDFNGDGNSDLAVFTKADAGTYTDGAVCIYLGDGTGAFGSATTLPMRGLAFGMAVADFNSDHKPDLAVSRFSNGINEDATVTILLGNGAGGFSTPVSFVLYGAAEEGMLSGGISAGDFNSDGNTDLAVSVSSFFEGGFVARILLGDGSGNFPSVLGFHSGRDAIVGDFNHDSKLDLAGAWEGNTPVIVNFGDGTGSFSEAGMGFYSWIATVTDSIGWQELTLDTRLTRRTATADFNFDGIPDVVTSVGAQDNQSYLPANKISILLGDGTGSFSLPIDFAVGSNPTGVTVADFNLDGKPDLAVPNNSDGTVSVLINSTYQTPVGVNQTVVLSNTTLTFAEVTAGGITTVAPIDPATAGEVPGGFAVSNSVAYEIHTTASFTGSVTLGFIVPAPISEADFNSLSILHSVNGTLVDVTATTPARNYASRTIYATTTSFSPFYLARSGPHIKALFDQTKAHKSGSTVPIELALLDVNNRNISSAGIVLTPRSLMRVSGNSSIPLVDDGDGDADDTFRFRNEMEDDHGKGYVFNLKTKGFARGSYILSFYAGNNHSFFYTVKFELK